MALQRPGRLPAWLLVALVAAPASAQQIGNKDLFQKSQEAARQALELYGEHDDPEMLRRVSDLGYRLAQESVYRDMPFTFYLVDMPEPNAFALPGGQIFLTRGMLELDLGDDALAGLLGHELGHVILEHGLKLKRRATLLNVLSQAVLAGVIIGTSGGSRQRDPGPVYDPTAPGDNRGDVIYGTAAAGAVVSELLLRSYSREYEDQADEEGQRLAAAAGFDPAGTHDLMETLRSRLPQSKEYGYWRTHPFFDERTKAAAVRQEYLKVQPPSDAAAYRRKTQQTLLGFADGLGAEPELRELIRHQALAAWPQGEVADGLRLEELHRIRDAELGKLELRRDFGDLVGTYRRHRAEVAELTPESPLLGILDTEIAEFDERRTALYPKAVEVFTSGVYETGFLETFLSNYPDAAQAADVSLALGTAYSRLSRQSDAVAQYLLTIRTAPDGEAAERARRGLRNLAPVLDRLDALARLAADSDDAEVRRLAAERLAKLASSYNDLGNGAAYLHAYPIGEHTEAVTARLDSLAEKLYGELLLYQTVGDHVKGIERIQKILTHAPNSPAAERLRERMVLES